MMINFSSPTCFAEATVAGPDKLLLSAFFLSLAAITFLLMRRNIDSKYKVGLIYLHLTFLFFPAVLLTTNGACGVFCMECHNNYPQLLTYAVPSTLIASGLVGMFLIPGFYSMAGRRRMSNTFIRKIVAKQAKRLGMKAPQLYVLDKGKPMAFSYRSMKSAIYMAVGMLDSFTKKELEAVVLHELAHISRRASMMKFSSLLMKMSPFSIAGFHDNGKEEIAADLFAAEVQGTFRYLSSAKRKMQEFD